MMPLSLGLAASAGQAGSAAESGVPAIFTGRSTAATVHVTARADMRRAFREASAAKRTASNALGLNIPHLIIVDQRLADEDVARSGSGLIYLWPFPGSGDVRQSSAPPATLLRHEIGHDLFIRFLVPRTQQDQYGGAAPDWLDEMAAVAFEAPVEKRMRRAGARRFAEEGGLIPLARLLAMTHPEWRGHGDAPAAGAVVRSPRSAETPAFYATVQALLDLLIDRTGSERVVRDLADQVRAGAPLDAWLLTHGSRTGPAAGLDRLDAEISAFVLSDPRYAKAWSAMAPGGRPN
jgi:hypothetical protein